MDRQTTQPMVLARIPDIATAANMADKEHETVPTSSGRVIGQSLSFKLLAGVVLLLVVAAVIPFALWKHGQSTDSPSATAEALPAWHPGSPAPSAATAPTWTPVAAVPASAPIPASPSPMPSVCRNRTSPAHPLRRRLSIPR